MKRSLFSVFGTDYADFTDNSIIKHWISLNLQRIKGMIYLMTQRKFFTKNA